MISGAAETAEEPGKGALFDSKGLQYTESANRLSGDLASVFHLHDLAAITEESRDSFCGVCFCFPYGSI